MRVVTGTRESTQTDPDRLSEPARSDEVIAGTEISHYVVERRLGAGGMGVVYAAKDSRLDRVVALKLVRPRAGDATQDRLHREARAMARLSHRNVVPVFDVGTYRGQTFVVMELVAGETLRAWMGRPRPWREVARVFARAASGLAAAHAAGLLHRDFKPDNVMIDRDGEPRITDFGLAREIAFEDTAPGSPHAGANGANGAQAPRTASGAVTGTPGYIAPELLVGAPGNEKADQFSCCVSLFEALYGTRPFRPASSSPGAHLAEIRAGRIDKPTGAGRVPRWLHAVALRGLAYDLERRWPSMDAFAAAIERGLGRRWRRIGVAVAATVIGAGTAAALWPAPSGSPSAPSGCAEVARSGRPAAVVTVCRDEYARTGDPATGLRLARALRDSERLGDAAAVARQLLVTPVRGDALYELGKIAAAEDRADDAVQSFQRAAEEHRKQGRWKEAVADVLAAQQFARDVVDQLVDLGKASDDAERAGSPQHQAPAHLAVALVLSKIGARAGALAELARVERLPVTAVKPSLLEFTRGDVHENLGERALAVEAFTRATALAEQETNAVRALRARLNLAYALTEVGRLDDAASQLVEARTLDPDDRLREARLLLEAKLAARRGELARAAGLVDEALATIGAEVSEDRLELEVQRAEIALAQRDLAGAERWARQAIASIEKLRSPKPPVELRSWMIVNRRIPYEILFASLARRGDAAQALRVFDQYRGAGVLAAMAQGEPAASPASGGALASGSPPAGGFPAGELAALVPPLAKLSIASVAEGAALDEALRGRSLLVLVVARGDVWRIVADGGRLDVARIDALSALRASIDRLHDAPGDAVAAAVLGKALVPAGLAAAQDRVLHVVLDQALAGLPVGALLIGDRRLGAARSIVVAARPSALACAPRSSGARRQIDGESPRGALLEAARAERLDVTARVETDALGPAFMMRDGRVRALEIAGRGAGPARVILAPVAGAAGPGDATSLALAFVAAGADQVIAPVGRITGGAAARLAAQLDREDRGDLAEALARIQHSNTEDAFAFAAFGRETCRGRP